MSLDSLRLRPRSLRSTTPERLRNRWGRRVRRPADGVDDYGGSMAWIRPEAEIRGRSSNWTNGTGRWFEECLNQPVIFCQIMVEWTTVAISVGTAFLIDVLGEYVQERRKEKRELVSDKEDWYRRVRSLATQIRDEALEIPYGSTVDLATLKSTDDARRSATLQPSKKLIADLQEAQSEAPAGVNREVKSAINDLIVYFNRLESDHDQRGTNDIRQKLEEHSEDIRRKVTAHSERYGDALN